MKTYSEYRAMARQSLGERWNEAALVTFLLFLLIALFQGPSVPFSTLLRPTWFTYSWHGIYFAALFVLILPLQYAICIALQRMIRGSEERLVHSSWDIFRSNFERLISPIFLSIMLICVVAVFTLCIGGIILSYAYAMVPFVIEDNPNMSPKEILRTSREMMQGHKWELFVLDLTFIGWILLSIVTLGIATFWVEPYMQTAHAHLYEDLKAEIAASPE